MSAIDFRYQNLESAVKKAGWATACVRLGTG